MKNLNKLTIGAAILGSLPLFAFAQVPTASVAVNPSVKVTSTTGTAHRIPNTKHVINPGATSDPSDAVKDVAYYIQKGDAAIAERLSLINKRISHIDTNVYLTAEQKTAAKAPLLSAITAMNAAKVKLDADTDLATAKADYSAIFKDNRVNMVLLKDERATESADVDTYLVGSSTARATELQAMIDAAKAAGKNVDAAQAALNAGKAKLVEISAKISYELSEAAKLVVDHGDKNIVAANKVAAQNAQTARQAINVGFKSVATSWAAVLAALQGSTIGSASSTVNVH